MEVVSGKEIVDSELQNKTLSADNSSSGSEKMSRNDVELIFGKAKYQSICDYLMESKSGNISPVRKTNETQEFGKDGSAETLNEKVSSLTRDLEEGIKQISEKEKEIDQLKLALQENLEKIYAQEKELVEAKENYSTLDKYLYDIQARLSTALNKREGEVIELKKSMDQLKEEHEKSTTILKEGQESQIKQSQERAKDLEEKIQNLEAELSNQAVKILSKESELEEMRQTVEGQLRQLGAAREQYLNLEEKLKSTLDQFEEIKAEKSQELERVQYELQKIVDEKSNELASTKIIVEEKENKITSLEAEVQNLLRGQQDSEKIAQQIQEAKVFVNDFNGMMEISAQPELMPALVLLVEQCKKYQDTIKQESSKVKELQEEVEKRAQNDFAAAEQGFLQSIDALEKERIESNKSLSEYKELAQKLSGELDLAKSEFSQTTVSLEAEKKDLLQRLEENENTIRTVQTEMLKKDAELDEARKNLEQERSLLQYELSESKIENVNSMNEFKDQNQSLRNAIGSFDEERLQLQERINEYTEKLELSMREVADLKTLQEQNAKMEAEINEKLESEQKLQEEKEAMKKKLEESEGQITEFQGKITAKDQYIEALIFDVNQMKEFIVEHHGEAIFEKDEKEDKEDKEAKEEVEVKTEEVKEPAQEDVVENIEANPPQETKPKKVTIYIEQPSYRPYYGEKSRYGSNYDQEVTERRRPSRSRRGYREVVYEPKRATEEIQEDDKEYETQYNSRHGRRSPSKGHRNGTKTETQKEVKVEAPKESKPEVAVKETKYDPKKVREEDPVYKQLEKMVIELNEKLLNSEMRAKKMCEEKLLEASLMQAEKEKTFAEQIQKLHDDKKELLKRIEDIQWDKAYEYTQKMNSEKKQGEVKASETAKKSTTVSDSKKKNKKK